MQHDISELLSKRRNLHKTERCYIFVVARNIVRRTINDLNCFTSQLQEWFVFPRVNSVIKVPGLNEVRQMLVSSIQDSSVTLESKQLKNQTNYDIEELYITENTKPMCQIWLRTSMPGSR